MNSAVVEAAGVALGRLAILFIGVDNFGDLGRAFVGKKQAAEGDIGLLPFPVAVGQKEGRAVENDAAAILAAGDGEGAAGAVGEGAAGTFFTAADIL